MPPIQSAIKRRRKQLGLTQQDMSDKLHVSLKTWQNIESGETKLDLQRLNDIAGVLDTNVIDLIESQDGIYIEQMTNESSQVGFSASEVTINNDVSKEVFELERKAHSRLLEEKDSQIVELRKEVASLKNQYQELVHKIAGKLL